MRQCAITAAWGVTIRRLLTDNGSAFRSRDFASACSQLGIVHKLTRAYRPQTIGKAARFIRSAQREWAYGWTYLNSAHRTQALSRWRHYYNWHRPHAGIGGQVPMSRLTSSRNNVLTLHTYVGHTPRTGAGSAAMSADAVAQRIKPVAGFELAAAQGAKALRAGEEVYTAQCSACHAVGAAGAPKLGDAAAWGPRIKTGYEALLNAALKGKNAMAAQGGGEYSDLEIGRAVVYMANQGGAKFDEPQAPEAPEAPASE